MSTFIRRGTTPTLTFTLPFAASAITALSIAFAQKRAVILEKKLSDVKIDGNSVSVTLTENETLSFLERTSLEIQMRCYCGRSKMASQIISVPIKRILKEGCLE